MNNASYARVGELCRWRILAEAARELSPYLFKRKVMYIVAEQRISYHKSIRPFSQYEVSTSLTVTDDKWLNFIHTFRNPVGDKKTVAEVYVKGVLKEATGKTIRPSEIVQRSSIFKYCLDEREESTP
jgi:acyl-CoA thioesterase FadM